MNYFINKPYPEMTDIKENPQYASLMLSNLAGLYSEMNAVSLYFYNHVILKDVWPELSVAMEKISIVEMHHLDIFAHLAYHLGADPRLWDCQQGCLEYWSPGYNVYPSHLKSLLENASYGELIEITHEDPEWIKLSDDTYHAPVMNIENNILEYKKRYKGLIAALKI